MISETNNGYMYFSYYLFGHSQGDPVWNWEKWEKCIPLLNPFISLCSELPTIKTNQESASSNGNLRFGKMIWNEKSNESWTTKYLHEKGWRFIDTEIAFPPRSYCHKNGTNPEILITIHNENLSNIDTDKNDQSISIHIRADLVNSEQLPAFEKNIEQIGAILNWKIAGKIRRESAYKHELGMGYTDSFWDGCYGVLAIGKEDFSANYKRYGIIRIK